MLIGKHAGGSSEWLIPDAGYVKAVVFYDGQGQWFSVSAGWLEHTENPEKYSNAVRVASIELSPVTRRIKKESAMAKCENFWMKSKAAYNFEKDGATLFIYLPRVSPDTVQTGENDLRTDYGKRYTLPFLATLDDGTKLNAVKVMERGAGLHRLTEFGKTVQAMDNAFALDGVPITGGDVASLLRLYNVTRRVPVENVVVDTASGRQFKEFTDAEISHLQDEKVLYRSRQDSTEGINYFTVSDTFKTTHGGEWQAVMAKMVREM